MVHHSGVNMRYQQYNHQDPEVAILQAIVPTDVTMGSMQYPVQLPLPPLAIKLTHSSSAWQQACTSVGLPVHQLLHSCQQHRESPLTARTPFP